MNTIIFIALILFIEPARSFWQLEWSDEFDQDTINLNKWEIDEGDKEICDKQSIGRLNCYTNSSQNIRLINGTLGLTAIYEKKLNRKFTSAWIKTANNFTYGRIDIRAALPLGKLLSPWSKIVPPKFKNTDGTVRRNQVIVFQHGIDQPNYVRYGASLGKGFRADIDDYMTTGGLNRFHTYSLIWNETDLVWMFDNHVTNWVNLTGLHTFLNEPIILLFYLRVGGFPYRGNMIEIDEVRGWSCSVLALDYVRYYQWVENSLAIKEDNGTHDRDSFDECKIIMKEILPSKEANGKSNGNGKTQMSVITIVSILCLVILVILIPLISWLVIRMRKMRDPVRNSAGIEYYDDIHQMDLYENVELKEGQYQDYTYAYDRKSNLYTDVETPPVQLTKISDQEQDYITMMASIPKRGGSYVK